MSEAYLRILGTAFRRYAADPATRQASARQMLGAALFLCAQESGAPDTALLASEYLSTLAAMDRRAKAARG